MTLAPAKYANLIKAGSVAPVPPTVLIDEALFAAVIADYARLNADIDVILEELAITSGAIIHRQGDRLDDILAGLALADGWQDRLAAVLSPQLPGWQTTPLAVRSAAFSEDQASGSSAGIYDSLLDVRGVEAVGAALLAVWRSYFRRAALVHRLSNSALCNGRRMTAMIQPMISAVAAGVAFSVDPVTHGEAVCEYAAGLADQLVAGAASARRLRASDPAPGGDDPLGSRGAAAVFATVTRLSIHFGTEIDVEWVWDGTQIIVVQVRPISTLDAIRTARSREPVTRLLPLYDAEEADFADFGQQPEFLRYFREKRRPLHLIARDLGLYRPLALALQVNRTGLAQLAAAGWLAAMARQARVVIDANAQVRQMIVAGPTLVDTMLPLLSEDGEVATFALRAFVSGTVGFISQTHGPDAVLLEYSRDGLLALNRGTADAHRLILSAEAASLPDWLDRDGARRILRATALAGERLGPVQLEWVSHAQGLTLLDYSPLKRGDATLALGEPDIVSRGFAHAAVLRLTDVETLADISEGPSISIGSVPDAQSLGSYLQSQVERIHRQPAPPIIVCERPYALLAALIPHVAGFVFRSASLLSHLSILIRESGKPALASPDLFARLADGEHVTLDLTRETRTGSVAALDAQAR